VLLFDRNIKIVLFIRCNFEIMAGHKRSAGDNDLVSSKKMAISDEMERPLHLPFEVNFRLYISDIANGVETRPIPVRPVT
jgi:hypothetical protein